ncbi:cell wall-binding repeat-containing protein [Clostridium oceanicum]|uniref:Cell wall-binding repeat-containing protein n=1 Tax=Clostridium oceanicum TaxID=1543 RepID=A0ABP3UYK5_9CLOT
MKNKRILTSTTLLSLVLATSIASTSVKAAKGEVERLGGQNRYETSYKVATSNWEKSDKVILVSGEGYADSLSAAVLSKKLNAPIILTSSKKLDENAKRALKTLKAKEVYVIGGEISVSKSIREELKKDDYKLVELGGKNRFETNLAVANYLADDLKFDTSNVLAVNGKDAFSDALSVASIAASKGQVLLITSKNINDVKLAGEFVEKHKSNVTVVGTENLVPKEILNVLGVSEKNRVNGGANRFETNLNVLKHFNIKSNNLYVANARGERYADALVGSALAGKFGAPLVLTDTKESKSTKNAIGFIKGYVKNNKDVEIKTLGGEKVMPNEVIEKVNNVLKEQGKEESEKDINKENTNDDNDKGSSSSSQTTGNTGDSQATTNKDQKDFQFSNGKITGYKGNKTKIIIPDIINGEKVTSIGNQAFMKKNLTYVKIPDTVEIIGEEAFRHNYLTSIDIPKSVTTIKESAFNGNKLQSLVIPDSVTKLEAGAFTLNEISSLKLSKGLKTIHTAFGYNKLTTITIPEGVTRIDDMTFSDNQLVEVKLPSTLQYLSGFNNNNFKSIIIPKNVKELGKKAFARNKISSVIIPGNVKVIGVSAFQNTWHDTFLTSVTIEEGVEKIDRNAFSLNHLKDVRIPSSVKELALNAFHNNLGYDGVVHLFTPDYKNPNKLEEYKYHIFNPSKLTVKYVFADKILKEEELWKNPATEEYFHVGDKSVEITPKYQDNQYELQNNSVRKIDLDNENNELIVKCKRKDIKEELTIKSINQVAPVVVDFGTSKDEVMSKLPEKAFIVDSNNDKHEVELKWILNKQYTENKSGQYTAVANFNLPEGVSQGDPELKLEVKVNILVKEKIENIENKWTVKDFNFEGTTITGFSEKGIEKLKNNKSLFLPKVNEKGETITNVGVKAFEGRGLTSLVIPEGLNSFIINTNAFEKNELTRVFIPEGVKEIDADAFNSNKLKYVDFPGTLKKIGNRAFANNQLVSATFSKDTENIALDRFSFYNNKLTSITILKEVLKIHEEAFKDNTACSSDGKVHIFTQGFDPNDCNQWFPNSDYHKIISLS